MKRFIAAMLAALFAFGSMSAIACPGDKAKDDQGGMSTPSGSTK